MLHSFHFRRKKGQSAIEFMLLVTFLLLAFMLLQKYIVRGFSGRWKTVGESLGQGRIYDPQRTTECAYDIYTGSGKWYDVACFESLCDYAACLKDPPDAECQTCLEACASAQCN